MSQKKKGNQSKQKQNAIRKERAEYMRKHQKHRKSKSVVRKELVEKEKELNAKKIALRQKRINQAEHDRLDRVYGNTKKKDIQGFFVTYPGNWKDIRKSTHVKYSHQRLNRYANIKEDDYIMLSIYEPIENLVHLFMSSGDVLIVALNINNSRKRDKLVTIIPSHKHIRKFIIDGAMPIGHISDKVEYD